MPKLKTRLPGVIHMKVFLWLLVLACAVWCVCCWTVSRVVVIVLTGMYPHLAWPKATELLLRPNGWVLLFPLPWLIYAMVLSRRRELTPGAGFLFAGTVVLALSILTCAIAVACLLPYVELYGQFEP